MGGKQRENGNCSSLDPKIIVYFSICSRWCNNVNDYYFYYYYPIQKLYPVIYGNMAHIYSKHILQNLFENIYFILLFQTHVFNIINPFSQPANLISFPKVKLRSRLFIAYYQDQGIVLYSS